MDKIDSFREMIKSLDQETLSELCEQFLHDHQSAMNSTIEFCNNYGVQISRNEITNCMMQMQSKGEFDDVICYGTELGINDLYKKFHPSSD